MEHYFSEITSNNDHNQDRIPLKCKPILPTIDKAEDGSDSMDCHICLDLVQDPVVTFCGHLYCWPCIYKWISFQSEPSVDSDQPPQPQCPVCKAEISEETLIPLYGRGLATTPSDGKAVQLGLTIPQRPQSPRCDGRQIMMVSTPTSGFRPVPRLSNLGNAQHLQASDNNYSSPRGYVGSPGLGVGGGGGGATANIGPHSGREMFGEMVYARIFGNSETAVYALHPNSYNVVGNSSPRIRRHVMEANKSLSRLTFFLFCCMILSLLLF